MTREEQFHHLIRNETPIQRMLNRAASAAFLELADKHYDEADASESEARQRYLRYWGDRSALEAL